MPKKPNKTQFCRVAAPGPAGAPRPQLRKAYLALALQYHPDKNTNASASGAFAAISRAWKAVSSA